MINIAFQITVDHHGQRIFYWEDLKNDFGRERSFDYVEKF